MTDHADTIRDALWPEYRYPKALAALAALVEREKELTDALSEIVILSSSPMGNPLGALVQAGSLARAVLGREPPRG